MEKFGEIFGNFIKMFTNPWNNLTLAKKIAFGAVVALMIVSIGSMFYFQDVSNREPLFVDLSDDDIADISAFLAKTGYHNYTIDKGKKAIFVPSEDINKIRIMLSEEGLPHKGLVGWEKFDSSDFTQTEFEQGIQKLRAIQGELERTISAIDGVTSARIHIVIPHEALFVREQKKPTAAIYIRTKRGTELGKKQIKGIQNLVSHAVEGLEPNQITIISADGKMISEVESTDETVVQSRELLSYKGQVEKNLEERIIAIVGKVVGSDRVEAKVDAEVDFTRETQTISDIDPDRVAVVAKNTSGFSMEGQGLNPTGIPGSKSNVPGEQEDLQASASKAGSKRDTELVNYEFSKTISEKKLPIGNIRRLTISAIVDGKQIYPLDGSVPEFEPRSNQEMKKIEELIKDAVGFKENRDSLTVHNLMFQLDPFQMMEIKKQKKEDRAYLSTLAMSAVIALAIIFFFAFIVRPYFRWLSYDPERKADQSIVEEYKPDLELGSMQNVQIQEDVPFEKLSPKEQVLYLARNEPKRTTEAIRIMLSPNSSGA